MKLSCSSFIIMCVVCVATFALATPQLIMQSISPEELKNRIKELEGMQKGENLSSDEKAKLDALWRNASKIQEMYDRCGTIDLTDVIDEDCGRLYREELPEFESNYFEVTGEIRLNPSRLSQNMDAKRSAIQECFAALPADAFYPTRYFELDGGYSAEPLEEGFELSFDFYLRLKQEAIDDLESYLQKWNNACHEYIMRSDGSGVMAPFFSDKIKQSIQNASKTTGSLYFRKMNDNVLSVETKNGIRGSYYVNGKYMFHIDFPSGSSLFSIKLGPNGIDLFPPEEKHRSGKVIFKSSDESKGLTGVFRWSNIGLTDSWGSSDSTSRISFFVQSMGGGAFPASGNIRKKLKDKYSDVWNKSEEWADSSLGLWSPFFTLKFGVEFFRYFAFSVGGGIAWSIADVSKGEKYHPETLGSHYYTESYEAEDLRTGFAPVVQAEITVGEPNILTGGIRETYIFDSEWPSNYLGGFLEVINMLGVEIGWAYNKDFWGNTNYIMFYLNFPPRHLEEFLKQ